MFFCICPTVCVFVRDPSAAVTFTQNNCWLRHVRVDAVSQPPLYAATVMSKYLQLIQNESLLFCLCVEARDSWIGRLFGRLPHPCLLIHCWWNKRTYGLLSPCITSPWYPSRLVCIFSPAQRGKKEINKTPIWIGFNRAGFSTKCPGLWRVS